MTPTRHDWRVFLMSTYKIPRHVTRYFIWWGKVNDVRTYLKQGGWRIALQSKDSLQKKAFICHHLDVTMHEQPHEEKKNLEQIPLASTESHEQEEVERYTLENENGEPIANVEACYRTPERFPKSNPYAGYREYTYDQKNLRQPGADKLTKNKILNEAEFREVQIDADPFTKLCMLLVRKKMLTMDEINELLEEDKAK
jgi:hypothetical protein